MYYKSYFFPIKKTHIVGKSRRITFLKKAESFFTNINKFTANSLLLEFQIIPY
jgi:hypothetical protein